MIAFGHTAVGTLVGLGSYSLFGEGNIVTGLLATGTAGVISHYIADTIPHGHFFNLDEFHQKIKYAIVFDFLASVMIFMLVGYLSIGLNIKLLYVLFGIGGAQLPDMLDGLIYTGYIPKIKLLRLEIDFHQFTHWHGRGKNGLLLGLYDVWQITAIAVAFALLLKG